MADHAAIPNNVPRPTRCSRQPGARTARRAAEDLPRRRPRRRQDLRDAAERAPGCKAGVDVVVGVVETHGRAETEALLDGLEVDPAPRIDYRDQVARGDGPRRDPRAPAAARARRRARPHQRAGQPPPEALPGRRGAARRRHRRLHHRQHPARREPQRRRRPDHPHPGARDRAGLDPRPRRRHRGDRPHPRRPDPAPEGRQGLRARAGRAGARALLLPRQPDRAARAGAARAPPSGSTTSSSTHMQANAIAGPWAAGERVLVCVSEDPRAAGLVRYAKRLADRAARALDRGLASRRGAACSCPRRSATASPTPCGSPSARRRGR